MLSNTNHNNFIYKDSSLNNIHISFGFSDACVDEIIKHLSSALEHLSSSSYLHVHIMNADNFTLETFTKIMNMVHKINNNTELIIYNANKVKEDFKIREDIIQFWTNIIMIQIIKHQAIKITLIAQMPVIKSHIITVIII